MNSDCIHPFLFEHLDIRGAIVSLDESWRNLQRERGYPAEVAALLGELSAVSVLIAANLKQPGRLTFQLRGDGQVNLLVLDCDEQLRLRGMARFDACQPILTTGTQLLGDGQLLLSLDSEDMRQPWQSVVPLEGTNLAGVFEHYLSQSEQTSTALVLAANAQRACGLFVQKLPEADLRDADGWNRIGHLLATLNADEQLAHAPLDLLSRLFPEETVRVFDARKVTHHCPEDVEKIHAMLRALGRDECDAVLAEHGVIEVRDDLCNRQYRLNSADIETLFAAPARSMH